MQMCGSQYYGEILSQSENFIVMDIAKAYKDGPEKLNIEYTTGKDFVKVKYYCKGIKEKICFHFVSDLEPLVKEDGVLIKNTLLSSSLKVQPKISYRLEKPQVPSRIDVDKAVRDVYLIDYEVCVSNEITAEFIFSL
jgi:hypothetical protein